MNTIENHSILVNGNVQQRKTLVGTFFELVIVECLLRKGIAPLYHQVILQHTRLIKFDWLTYYPTTTVLISCKRSARKRWNQTA